MPPDRVPAPEIVGPFEVHTLPSGETRITLVSDDNFNDWERSLLLEFSLPK